jgi:hypothetical protein
MLIGLWIVASVSGVAAIFLWRRTRRVAAQLEQLSHRYWQLQRLTGGAPGEAERPHPTMPGEGFVPLASLKR